MKGLRDVRKPHKQEKGPQIYQNPLKQFRKHLKVIRKRGLKTSRRGFNRDKGFKNNHKGSQTYLYISQVIHKLFQTFQQKF